MSICLDGPATIFRPNRCRSFWLVRDCGICYGRQNNKKFRKNSVDAFDDHLEIWKDIHCKILYWFINTCFPSIRSLLPKFQNVKVAWNFFGKSIQLLTLMMVLTTFSWIPYCISCIKSLVNLLLSFTPMLVVSRIISLKLIHLFLVINLSNFSRSIEIVNNSSVFLIHIWDDFENTSLVALLLYTVVVTENKISLISFWHILIILRC